jgi:hypothetical protein
MRKGYGFAGAPNKCVGHISNTLFQNGNETLHLRFHGR